MPVRKPFHAFKAVLVAWLVVLPAPAFAWFGLWIFLPAAAVLWWIAVLPFLLEWMAVKRVFDLSTSRAFGAVVQANSVSTLVGICLGIPVGFMLDAGMQGPGPAYDNAVVPIALFVFFFLVTATVNAFVEFGVIGSAIKTRDGAAPDKSKGRWAMFRINLASGVLMVATVYALGRLGVLG